MCDVFSIIKDYEVLDLEKLYGSYLIRMKYGQNKINDKLITAFNDALDIIEQDTTATCLITTGHDKFFSTGLDLAWVSEQQTAQSNFLDGFTCRFNALLARIMCFPLPTVAAISGHAIGAGGFLALVHDFRIMRRHRGSFAIPLARIHFPLSDALRAILAAKVADPRVVRDLILFARRLSPIEALHAGIADQVLGHVHITDRTNDPVSSGSTTEGTGLSGHPVSNHPIAPHYESGVQSRLPEQTSVPAQNIAENEALIQASLHLLQQIPGDLRDRTILTTLKERIHAKPLKTLRSFRLIMPIRPELGFAQRVYAADVEQPLIATPMTAPPILDDIVVSNNKSSSNLTTTMVIDPQQQSQQQQSQSHPHPHSHSHPQPHPYPQQHQTVECSDCANEPSSSECSRLRPARLYSSSSSSSQL